MNKNYIHIAIILFLFSFVVKAQITGIVFKDSNANNIFDANEKGLQNILVSNGRDIVTTNKNGEYAIKKLEYNPIFIIKPKGFISPINKNKIVTFFANPLNKKQQVNFPLRLNKEKEKVKAVILGDPQVDVVDDVHHVAKLVTEELVNKDFDFMIPVGDLSFDNFKIFKLLSKTLGLVNKPVFYTIGNHDIDFTQSFNNVNEKYEAHFGPSYYAFEYGNELFLVLNNIYPQKANKYVGRINNTQYQFVQNLLQHKKGIKKVTIFMHIPLEETIDKNRFIHQFKNIENIFIVAGHTHTQYHKYFKVKNSSSIIHELVAGAVCGAWWQGPHDLQGIPFALMYDGTEKGYWFANFYKNKVYYRYKVSGKPSAKQINIWAPEKKEWNKELNKLNEPYIYANVFAADEFTNVFISFNNGKDWLPMNHYKGIAPELKRLHFLQSKGKFKSLNVSKIPSLKHKSKHLWRIAIPKNLKKGTHLITVKAINEKLKLNTTEYKVFWNEE